MYSKFIFVLWYAIVAFRGMGNSAFLFQFSKAKSACKGKCGGSTSTSFSLGVSEIA
jgi:hypothetical protein